MRGESLCSRARVCYVRIVSLTILYVQCIALCDYLHLLFSPLLLFSNIINHNNIDIYYPYYVLGIFRQPSCPLPIENLPRHRNK
jgi:hypothetical protein